MTLKKLAIAAGLTALVGMPFTASADSDFQQTVSGSATATANLNFEVNIPGFVYFQVGSATATDTVVLDITAGGAPVPQNPPEVPVILRTNAGDVIIDADGAGTELTGQTDGSIVIPWTEITADNTLNGGTGQIDPPAINGSSTITADAAGLIDASDVWTFSFANNATYAAQQYLGSVVFTASVGP